MAQLLVQLHQVTPILLVVVVWVWVDLVRLQPLPLVDEALLLERPQVDAV